MVRKAGEVHGKLPSGGHQLNTPFETKQMLAAYELNEHWADGVYDFADRYFDDESQEPPLDPLLFKHWINLTGQRLPLEAYQVHA